MRTKNQLLTLFIIFLLGSVIFGFSYSPRRFELIETANTKVTYKIVLNNNSDLTENIFLNLNTWLVSDNQVMFYPLKESWLEIETTNIQLTPGEENQINFILNVPQIQGEKRAEINFKSYVAGSKFTLSKSIPIFLIVKDTEIIDLEIRNINKVFSNDGKIVISTVFQNKGNIHIRPRVDVRTKGAETWTRVADDVPIYPESERTVSKVLDADELLDDTVIEVRMLYYNTQGNIVTKNYSFNL